MSSSIQQSFAWETAEDKKKGTDKTSAMREPNPIVDSLYFYIRPRCPVGCSCSWPGMPCHAMPISLALVNQTPSLNQNLLSQGPQAESEREFASHCCVQAGSHGCQTSECPLPFLRRERHTGDKERKERERKKKPKGPKRHADPSSLETKEAIIKERPFPPSSSSLLICPCPIIHLNAGHNRRDEERKGRLFNKLWPLKGHLVVS
ncbi:hypothetical protein LX32DRAFT_333364 [Colletotrichum zoysiae]|uniref:Uncharacterized protein n=1 Tax=Colletotrichum zoysiae TaxID=1216348 RepID=A0AAD9HJN1_9PEZI|nr:hypothetical protein LX32DRAFT_333364 [Colletotrichum zoysiae]